MSRRLTPAQQAMVEDGMPSGLMFTTEERRANWAKNPPLITKQEAKKKDFLEEYKAVKKEKSRVRVERMMSKKTGETKQMPLTGKDAVRAIELGRIPDVKGITVLIKKYPREQNSKRAEQFRLAQHSKTLDEFISAGGKRAELLNFVKWNWVKLTENDDDNK